MNDNITKLSPAKINLYLEVLEKTSSGYHNIESLMTFCDFGDIISIKKANTFKFTIDGPFSKKLSLKDNIVLKSVAFIEKLLNKNLAVHIQSDQKSTNILRDGWRFFKRSNCNIMFD